MTDRDRCILGKDYSEGGAVTKTDDAECIASMEEYIEGTTDEWTLFKKEFTYNNEEATPEKINIIISANDYFSVSPVGGNTIIVDDVKLVYYHALKDVTYNGAAVEFDAENHCDMLSEAYDASKLSYAKVGVGASVESVYNEETCLLTLTVKGNDYDANPESITTYTIQFKQAAEPVVQEVTNPLSVSINGQVLAPQDTKVQFVEEVDGSYSFVLKNFKLSFGEGAEIAVGNINLNPVVREGNHLSYQGTTFILPGDDPEVIETDWFGPMLGEVPIDLDATIENDGTDDVSIIANIDIDMSAILGQVIKVVLAPVVEIVPGSTLSLNGGLANVAYNRSFPAGWSTICLPFDYSTGSFLCADGGYEGTIKVQQFTGSTDSELTFEEVEMAGDYYELKANVPYLIYFSEPLTGPTYFSGDLGTTAPQAVTNGDWTFVGNYEAPFSMKGNYGVMDKDGVQKIALGGEGSTLGSTSAYFTYSGSKAVQGMMLNLGGGTTGIQTVGGADSGNAVIYDLSGRRVQQAVKGGVYILNGKKFIK